MLGNHTNLLIVVKTSTLIRVGHGHGFPTWFIGEGTKEDYYTMIKII